MILEKTYTIDEECPVSDFLQYYTNEKTCKNARIAIHRFLTQISGECIMTDVHSLDTYASRYLKQPKNGRNYVHDLQIAGSIFMEKYAPSTIHLILAMVTLWLEDCGYTLNRRERQRIFMKLPPAWSIRNEAELTRPMFQRIYHNLKHDWARVILLVLLGSGMRIGETLSIRYRDISWNEARVSITLHAINTKTQKSRTVYLTREGADALKAYLATRPGLNPESRVFPMSISAVEHAMQQAVDATGYGKQGNSLRQVHWHMTRKWFISRFSLYASKEVAEELAGHDGYLSRSYQRFTKRQILAQFAKAEKYLTLFPISGANSSATMHRLLKNQDTASTTRGVNLYTLTMPTYNHQYSAEYIIS